jgi:hypothetical protein
MTKLVVFQIMICSVSFILNLIYITMKYDISLTTNVFVTGIIMFNLSLAVTILAMPILMFNLGVKISKPKTSSGDEQ